MHLKCCEGICLHHLFSQHFPNSIRTLCLSIASKSMPSHLKPAPSYLRLPQQGKKDFCSLVYLSLLIMLYSSIRSAHSLFHSKENKPSLSNISLKQKCPQSSQHPGVSSLQWKLNSHLHMWLFKPASHIMDTNIKISSNGHSVPWISFSIYQVASDLIVTSTLHSSPFAVKMFFEEDSFKNSLLPEQQNKTHLHFKKARLTLK